VCFPAFGRRAQPSPFAADVGVGQGSAMSPILSALYLTLIMRRFRASDVGRKVDLMSYVDDGTIIAQSRRVEDNLPLLKEAYGWLFRAFESLGLVLEHDKSEVFHFSHARSFVFFFFNNLLRGARSQSAANHTSNVQPTGIYE
jgi:hypothetical protein